MKMTPSEYRYFFLALIIISVAFQGCNNQNEKSADKPITIQNFEIDTLKVFTSFETHDIAQPSDVKILKNGHIAIADYGQQTISILKKDGSLIHSFGRQGRGPGEFLNIRDILTIGEHISVYDSHQNRLVVFNYSGELLRSESFSSASMNKETTLINDSLYVIGIEGVSGSLLQVQNFKSDSVFNFGTPKAEKEQGLDLKKSKRQLKAGKVPNFFKNKVILNSDGTHIYAFFEALSELQKYDLHGNLLWSRMIDLPNNKQIFEDIVESAKENTNARSIPVLNYIADFLIIEDNMFILTARPSGGSQYIVKLNKQGEIVAEYSMPENATYGYDIDINPEDNTAYFTSWSAGIVYKGILPE